MKSIYFDKPGQSNWFVAWHQDLTISVRDYTFFEIKSAKITDDLRAFNFKE